MCVCVDELEPALLAGVTVSGSRVPQREDSGVGDVGQECQKPWRMLAVEAGRRMRKQLGDIMREYGHKIGECTMVLDGMALSAQLASSYLPHCLPLGIIDALGQPWSQIGYQDAQVNLKIASETRKDSSRMRSIAFLTMFFLPATFLAVCPRGNFSRGKC